MSLARAERRATEELESEVRRLRDDVFLLQRVGRAANRWSCAWNSYHATQEQDLRRGVEPLLWR